MLEIDSLECVRGTRTLFSDLSLRIPATTIFRVSGSNGSGKTSLLRIICGLLQPDRGEVRWNGVPIRDLREAYGHDLLYVGHRNGIKDELTPMENLAFWLALNANNRNCGRVAEALASAGLTGFERTPCRFLSQGQKRRVAIARLFLSQSKPLWILDEPLTALDADGIAALSACMLAHAALGNIVCLTTHQEPVIERASVAVHLDLNNEGRPRTC